MRIGIISDLHSNLEALQAVLRTLPHLKIDRIVCLGDLVGYGADPDTVVTLVRPLADFTIMGNHDAAVARQMDYHYYYEAAREALDWTRAQLSDDNLTYLKELPYFRVESGACFTHGDPISPHEFNYIYTLEQARQMQAFYELLQPVTFVGHSHLRRAFQLSPTETIELPVDNLTLREDRKYIIAVGSVGQPRDYDARAGFVIYQTDTRRVEFYRVAYDIDRAAEKILNAGLSDYFASRLYGGE